ncbi:tetraacyldisaccharide 4'-kinase [Agarivorans sp.]|uniref:tetraacyldisaccharide 4'-kinase n=1 Tax=Agarivorans sp. TaxID=1872412 RepID=UPI003CFC0D79
MKFWYQNKSQHLIKLTLLLPLSYLFRFLAKCRRFAYAGFLTSYRSPVPVVVVGNISVGGNGKTPVVLALVEQAQRRGYKPGVVSRGYGAKAPSYPYVVHQQSLAKHCGDEPLLIHLRTQCPVVVDPNRSQACQTLLEQGVDLVICDDGLQHYALQRDIEIVVIEAQRGLGNKLCLPAGPLREPPQRLSTVDMIISNGEPAFSKQSYSLQLKPCALRRVSDGQPYLGDKQFDAAMAGIGNPQRFFDSLASLNCTAKQQISLSDHRELSHEQYQELHSKRLIMTEKDAIKYRGNAGQEWVYLPVDSLLPDAFYQHFFSLLQEKQHVSRT